MAKFVLISFKWVRRPLVHQQEMMKWAERVVNIQKGRCFTKRLISARKFFKPCFKSCFQKGGYAICITKKQETGTNLYNSNAKPTKFKILELHYLRNHKGYVNCWMIREQLTTITQRAVTILHCECTLGSHWTLFLKAEL